MPAVLALPALWGAVGAGAAGAATIYGANKSAGASEDSNATTRASNAAAIAEQQRQDAQQKEQFDQQQAAAKAQWDAQQQIRAPYRQAGLSALSKLGDLLGTHFDTSMMQAPAYAPPSGGAPSPMANPQNPPPFVAPQTMKLGSMMGGLMSPGARTIIDPATGKVSLVTN